MKNIFSIFLLIVLYVPLLSASGDHGIKDATEPTVTQEEADILKKVVELSRDDVDKAIKFLEPSIRPSSSAPIHFALGNLYFQNDDLQKAEASYKEALKKYPHFMRARANLAQVFIRQDRIDEALEQLKVVLLEGKPRASTLTLIGFTFLLKNQPIPAETAYRQALLIEPDDINAYMGLAKTLLMQERFKESKAILRNILEDRPYEKELWFLLANANMALDKTDEAITALECARRLKVATSDALATLGDLYLNSNQPEQALLAYEESFSVEKPSIDRMLRAVEGYFMLGDYTQGDVMLNRIKEIERQDITRFSGNQIVKIPLEARRAHHKGDYKTAEKAYQKFLEQDPLNGDAIIAFGDLYKEQNKFEEAIIYYERAQRISGNMVEAFILHAQVEVERENYALAVELLENAYNLDPKPYIAKYLKQVRRLAR